MMKRGEVFVLSNPLFLGGLILALVIILFSTQSLDEKYLTGSTVIGEDYIGLVDGEWDFVEWSNECGDSSDVKKSREKYVATITQVNDLITFTNKEYSLKGKGKFVRFASPGKWKENFTEKEIKTIQEIMGPTLTKLGYAGS